MRSKILSANPAGNPNETNVNTIVKNNNADYRPHFHNKQTTGRAFKTNITQSSQIQKPDYKPRSSKMQTKGHASKTSTTQSTQIPKPDYKPRSAKMQTTVRGNTKNAHLNSIETNKLNGHCGPKLLVSANLLNTTITHQLDNGSQVNVISKYDIPDNLLKNLNPSSYTIQSYTGDEVPIVGTFEAEVQIGTIEITCHYFVVDGRRQAILGTPATVVNGLTIDHENLISVNIQLTSAGPSATTALTIER